ncbi:MAG: GntR family transcriptional regulator [Planctomycetota bacterium]|jgi:DNA-binding GntR family transcriptional regulator
MQSRKEHAYRYIREQLRTGQLKPGDRLAEVNLAKEINVSRGPLREAIGQLASEGLVQQTTGLGAYVRSPDVDEIREIYETREALECFIVEQAAQAITDAHLDQLQQYCDRMGELLRIYRAKVAWKDEHRQALLDADTDFHAVIAQVAPNSRIEKLLKDYRLLQRMLAYQDQLVGASTLSTRSWAWGQHVRILRALRNRDADAARRAMSAHVQTAMRNALAAFGALQERNSGANPIR